MKFLFFQEPIFATKHQTSCEGYTLVSIDKSVITAKIKQISSGNLDRIGNPWLPYHGCLRGSDGRLQQFA